MTAEVDICNMALNRIGATDTIAEFNERSKAAKLCRTFYAQSRDAVLRDFPWPFATRYEGLAIVPGTPPDGWLFQYRYPSDCLMAQKLTTTQGEVQWLSAARFNLRFYGLQWGLEGGGYWPPRIPYSIAADDEGQLILTNLQDARLIYTAQITDVSRYDPLFKSALAWYLAVELVMPMTADPKRVQLAEQKYQLELSKAEAASFNEEQDFSQPESHSITVRY